MCGITGIAIINEKSKYYLEAIESAVKTLSLRGPDNWDVYKNQNIALGHTRLSVIDTSAVANQPFTDNSGRYTIVYNGEFYNYKEHRKALIQKGITFRSHSDTEVLLHLFIQEGIACLKKVNGFFAFAIYDKQKQLLTIARDRIGIKPLLYYWDNDKFIFASEMKAIMAFGIKKEMDVASLYTYLQLNYIPIPNSILNKVKKITPGSYMQLRLNAPPEEDKQSSMQSYYTIPYPIQSNNISISYSEAKEKLSKLLDKAVQERLIADVPIGTFLSGGIDSSIITALAARHTPHLNTFSIGFKDEPFFDETHYAQLVAKKHKTNHTVFSLSNDDLLEHLYSVLDYLDEPFADSSALAVYILSKRTKQHVTVALSGDGADELFAGYNKHQAHYFATKKHTSLSALKYLVPLLKILPQSRQSKWGNIGRQLNRMATGMKLSTKERYWRWASYLNETDTALLLHKSFEEEEYLERKKNILKYLTNSNDLNEVLYTDMKLVLPNDMLTKVDMMSMANGLEIRVPFLAQSIVDFVFSLPSSYKIDGKMRKKILQDTFRELLPNEIFNRSKHGFEIPLLKWFNNELKSLITDNLLQDAFIQEQDIFNPDAINQLKKQLFSNNPKDSVATVWALIVFQYWWKKYLPT